MSQSQLTGIIVMAVVFVILLGLAYCSNNYSLDKIKRKTVGQGQHGTARWANKNEIKNSYTKYRNIFRNNFNFGICIIRCSF